MLANITWFMQYFYCKHYCYKSLCNRWLLMLFHLLKVVIFLVWGRLRNTFQLFRDKSWYLKQETCNILLQFLIYIYSGYFRRYTSFTLTIWVLVLRFKVRSTPVSVSLLVCPVVQRCNTASQTHTEELYLFCNSISVCCVTFAVEFAMDLVNLVIKDFPMFIIIVCCITINIVFFLNRWEETNLLVSRISGCC